LLGCSEYALRLFPLICGIASVLLFAWVTGRILAGPARLLSFGLLAVAYHPIRHSAESRQYASDLFFAVLLIALGVGYLTDQPGRRRRWWIGLAAALPVALVFSLPSVFVATGLVLALGWAGGKSQTSGSREAWFGPAPSRAARLVPAAVLGLLLVAAFGALWLLHLRPLYEAARSGVVLPVSFEDSFPPLDDSRRLLLWLLKTHTGKMFSYVDGGPYFGSVVTTVLFVLGCVEMGRRRQTTLLLLLTTPFLAGLTAAALRLYPYGANERLVMYVGPAICLIAGLGAAMLLERLPTPRARRRALLAATLALGAFGLAVAVDSVLSPYKGIDYERERRFARSFWRQMAADAEVVSLKTDLSVELEPKVLLWASAGFNAAFHYYRAACGPPALQPDDVRWRRLGPGHPLRAVAWTWKRDPPPDSEAAWLASISGQYRLQGRRVFSVNKKSFYLVYDLVPIVPGSFPLPPFPSAPRLP
jgi:hypothetical protein